MNKFFSTDKVLEDGEYTKTKRIFSFFFPSLISKKLRGEFVEKKKFYSSSILSSLGFNKAID
jgi:hypothetical protein